MPPADVEALMGVAATHLGAVGARPKSGTPFQRSFAQWAHEFGEQARLVEMIPTLLESVGGVGRLASVKQAVAPEFLEIDLSLWIKDSPEQEGGFIDASTIAQVAALGATLSFGFYTRDDA
jgi:hypothetical protein